MTTTKYPVDSTTCQICGAISGHAPTCSAGPSAQAADMTTTSQTKQRSRREGLTRCTNDGPHEPHGWHGRICPGLTDLAALTLSQVEVIADGLGLNGADLLVKLASVHGGERMSATTSTAPIFVSVKQAAAMLALSRWSVERLCQAGELDSRMVNGRRLVLVESLDKWARSLPNA